LTNSDSGALTGKEILEELIAEADSNPSGSKGAMNDNHFRHSCREIIRKADVHRESPLLTAIRSGDFELARFLIKAKADIAYRGPSGETLLHWLSTSPLREATDIARLILATGVDMHQPTRKIWRVSSESHFPSEIPAGSTALEIAIDYDHLDMVKFLLSWETEHPHEMISTSEGLFSRAAQSQAYLTLQYFCEDHSNAVNEFDQQKFSPFYYACRPDTLQRLLRYRPQSHEYPVSVENKAKAVVEMLLRAGSNLTVRSDELFGPFHLLASVEDPEMLQLALGGSNTEQWLNASTNFYDKATPLKEAAIKGHLNSMRLLLEKGASPANIDASGGHVLHVCALAPGDVAVEQAKIILDRFPSAINARSGFLQAKALYSASWYGNEQLIRFLLDLGSDPRKVSHHITALGAAIYSRSITAVKVLCEEYQRKRWPLLAALYAPDRRPNRFTYFHTGTYVSAISFLLTPGAFSPVESRLGHPNATGSYDHPFSHTSEIILDILLAASDSPRLPWTIRFPLLSTPLSRYPGGLNEAVRLGNSKLIDKIYSHQEKNHKIEFNILIAIALDQLALKQNHIATVDERKKVLKHVRGLEEATYDREQRDRRTHNGNFLTRCYWSMNYSLYNAPKHRLFIRIWDGVQEDTLGRLNDRVFNRWLVYLYELDWPLMFSVWGFIVFMMWGVFLVPMITCLGVYSMDSRSGWSKGNTVNLAVVAILVRPFVSHEGFKLLI
jgi:ankyrin repeat protein